MGLWNVMTKTVGKLANFRSKKNTPMKHSVELLDPMVYSEVCFELPSNASFESELNRIIDSKDTELSVVFYMYASYISKKDGINVISAASYSNLCKYILDNWKDIPANNQVLINQKDLVANVCSLRVCKHPGNIKKGQDFPFQFDKIVERYIDTLSLQAASESWEIVHSVN